MEHWCLVPIESLTFTSHTWNNFHLDTLLLQKIHFLPTPAKHLQIPNKKRHKTSTSIHHTSHDKLTYKLLHQHNHTKTIPTKTHQWITPFKSHNSCPSFCKTQKKLMYLLLPQVNHKKIHFINIYFSKQLYTFKTKITPPKEAQKLTHKHKIFISATTS